MPRIGLGLGLRAWIARVSSDTVPPDASGVIGDVTFVTSESLWYEKRWVANREGAGDSILFPINLLPSVGDFDFSVRVRFDNPVNASFITLASGDPWGANSNYNFSVPSPTLPSINFRGTSPVYGTTVSSTAWVTIRATGVAGVVKIYQNGVETGSGTSAGQTIVANTGARCLWSPDGALAQSIKACDIRLTGPGGSIIAPLNEGTGTVITNQAGANGTLTDGSPTNFWYAAWVPMDVPTMDFRIPDNSQYIGAI